jgi:hypothetical protein
VPQGLFDCGGNKESTQTGIPWGQSSEVRIDIRKAFGGFEKIKLKP